MNKPVVEAKGLKMYFPVGRTPTGKPRRLLKAVDDVSFSIGKGQTFGLVGESGCGKTTVGRCLVRLYEPTDGEILFDGQDIARLKEKELFPYRRRMQMIFQDPYASLNPRMTVASIIAEPLLKSGMTREQRDARVRELVDLVGLKPDHMQRYPHEFSGGQRQRVGIARALSLEPRLIICDEPVSALDVSVQAQVLNLFCDLQEELGLSYLFIGHGLAAVNYVSDRIAVMYLGQIVEIAPAAELFAHPVHPYTRSLCDAAPLPDPSLRSRETVLLRGEIGSAIDPPAGCRFAARCPFAQASCREACPQLAPVAPGSEHQAACPVALAQKGVG